MKTLQIIKQDQDKTISLVEHETSHTKYIQKELNYYDKTLYQTLQKIKNPYLPKIFVIQESDNHLFETLYLIFDYPYKYYTFKHFEV